MKTTIKSVTITIEELRKLVADSASGNVDAANEFIEAKISEKKALRVSSGSVQPTAKRMTSPSSAATLTGPYPQRLTTARTSSA